MKDIRYNISLYIIIPLVFAGIALLSIIISYQVTGYYLNKSLDPFWPLSFWAIVIMILTVISGVLIVRMFMYPLEQFIKRTEKLGVLKNVSGEEKKPETGDDMSRFTRVFEQVTELLSKVEAREFFPQIIGQSKVIRGVLSQIMKVAPTDSTVLIFGETGTGKELVTKSIHEHSAYKGKPFVTINCAAIPETLLESELFGYEKGAFTGANASKPGKFEIANGGTLFLDEIGDMPLETQAKILRVIQDGQVERVGGTRPVKVNVRLITATNKDLSRMVDEGSFRQDLFYRLNVFSIYIQPLRERREDIPLLVDYFIKQLKKTIDVSSDSMQLLTAYNWPGNARELKNTVESASILAKDVIEPVHLPPAIKGNAEISISDDMDTNAGIDQRLKDLEKGIIIDALMRCGGVQVMAAKRLGIKERSLWHRIKKLEIDVTSLKHVSNK